MALCLGFKRVCIGLSGTSNKDCKIEWVCFFCNIYIEANMWLLFMSIFYFLWKLPLMEASHGCNCTCKKLPIDVSKCCGPVISIKVVCDFVVLNCCCFCSSLVIDLLTLQFIINDARSLACDGFVTNHWLNQGPGFTALRLILDCIYVMLSGNTN